mmetsp:Transcript_22401/g.49861  ORF Transcript_22401/g.49861 Transcript_22401/m.49861 type:complete len:226 (+) Transcript_22401:480-1157(+)
MWSRLPEPFSRSTASTARAAKWSFSTFSSLEDRVVRAMFMRSSLNASSLLLLSTAAPSSAFLAICAACLQPAMMVMGWMRWLTRNSASLSSSPHSTVTEVVPSPTVSSCMRAMSTSTLAAGFSTGTERRMVAPSFVMVIRMLLGSPTDCNILSMPLGPRVVLTRSAMAMAPTKEDMRALEPLKTSASDDTIPSADIVWLLLTVRGIELRAGRFWVGLWLILDLQG